MTATLKQPKVASPIARVEVAIRNIQGSPLVVHAFADKAKQQIRDKQQKKARKAKEQRDPTAEYEAAKIVDADGWDCVPITAMKKAIVSAATAFDDLTKVGLRQALFVMPHHDPAGMLLRIETEHGEPCGSVMREDAVTIGVNTRGLAYRPEYTNWWMRFAVDFNPRLVSAEQLRALIEQAGWGVGICEGRPEKSSALGWGRFAVLNFESI